MMYSKGQINAFTITIAIISIILLIVIALYALGQRDEVEPTMNAVQLLNTHFLNT